MSIQADEVSPSVETAPEVREHPDEAERLLLAIEGRVAYLAEQIRRAAALLLDEEGTVGSLAARPAAIADIEAHASDWESFVPDSPAARAALAHLLGRKYAFTHDRIPRTRAILRLDEPATQAAFEQRYGCPLSTIYRAAFGDSESRETRRDDDVARDITAELTWASLPKGEVLMRQGDPAGSMFVLMHGRLALYATDERGESRLLGELGPGDTVGEFALLTGGVRSATVTALRDCELVELSQEGFDRLVDQHPRALLPITRSLVRHLIRRTTNPTPRTRLSTIAVIPVAGDTLVGAFARHLTEALARFGPATHITRESVARDFGPSTPGTGHPEHGGDANDHALVAWLNMLETDHDYVVYEADASWTPWTERCVRQADRLLLLAPFGASTGDSVLRREVVGSQSVERHLVLVHPAGAVPPKGTMRYLEEWQPARHYHLRDNVPADLERLTRSLLGRGIGLVLGGGGARAFAHIGVLRALTDAGVPIDYVAGTSAGAAVAAEYAMGWKPSTILQRSRALVSKRLLDYTFPLVSLVAAKRFTQLLEELFGDVQIEDLWLPFFCVSSNLTSADIVVHQRGSLRRAIRASSSLPGVLPPLVENGQLLVDGLILNNLPVDVMQQISEGGPVIAVDVSMQFDVHSNYQYGEHLSALQTLWSRWNPFASSKLVVPGILSVILRSTELHHVYTQNTQIGRASLYLHPPVDSFGTFDVKPIDELVEIGYQYARDRITAWPLLDELRQLAGIGAAS